MQYEHQGIAGKENNAESPELINTLLKTQLSNQGNRKRQRHRHCYPRKRKQQLAEILDAADQHYIHMSIRINYTLNAFNKPAKADSDGKKQRIQNSRN